MFPCGEHLIYLVVYTIFGFTFWLVAKRILIAVIAGCVTAMVFGWLFGGYMPFEFPAYAYFFIIQPFIEPDRYVLPRIIAILASFNLIIPLGVFAGASALRKLLQERRGLSNSPVYMLLLLLASDAIIFLAELVIIPMTGIFFIM